MARIKRTESSSELKVLGEDSRALNENKDCTVKALALVCNISYKDAHATMKRLGRKDGRGIPMRRVLKEALAAHGFKSRLVPSYDMIKQYPGCHKNLQSVTTHHPARFPKVWKDGRNYLFFVARHVAAVIDGRTHDWTEGRAKRCEDIYEITKVELPKPMNDRPNIAPNNLVTKSI